MYYNYIAQTHITYGQDILWLSSLRIRDIAIKWQIWIRRLVLPEFYIQKKSLFFHFILISYNIILQFLYKPNEMKS